MDLVLILLCAFYSLTQVSSSDHDLSCECGNERITSRIIGGEESDGQFPWTIFIRSNDENDTHTVTRSCTGSIITDKHILTAAHCIKPHQRASDLRVYTFQGCGKEEKIRSSKPIRVKRVFTHHDYDHRASGSSADDIAILELGEPFKFNETFTPVCLSDHEFNETKYVDNLVAAGWGKMNSGVMGFWHLQDSDCLRFADLELTNDTDCAQLYKGLDTNKTICAGGTANICDGDSGGPLMTRRDGRVFLVGVTSFGTPDCGFISGIPSGFERVPFHIDWIKRMTENRICLK